MSKIEIENCILTFLVGFLIVVDCVCIICLLVLFGGDFNV